MLYFPLIVQGFSVLRTYVQGDIGSIWSSIGFYVFSIHVPLSFGGLSAAAMILHQPLLEPHIEVNLPFFNVKIDTFNAKILYYEMLKWCICMSLIHFVL